MADESITRRHLPHWFVPGAYFFVTYRLEGTIPRAVLDDMKARKEIVLAKKSPPSLTPWAHRERIHKLFFAEYDRYLDNNREIQWLADPRVAAAIRENLYHHRGIKYSLLSYCVMPNHVHVLLRPNLDMEADGGDRPNQRQARPPVETVKSMVDEQQDRLSALAQVMHSLKSYTATRANKILGRSGTFWQDESYDHWVRDEDELIRIVEYIAANPVKAGLVQEPHQWYFCSAHDRFLQDGSHEGWLLP
jgi:putative DNA methylase